ncbi:MAG: HAD family hydrolase [Pirellulales bacterium]|nr:HAD family hydrolase [Pirellulales bacterium]
MSTIEFKRERHLLVGIDSDGCVFDTMELKHKECFIPAFIKHFGLQGVSKYAREAAEFVNLYSKSRGVNRFPGLVEQLDWLRRRPEVQARGVSVPRLEGVRRWIASESKLGNPALERAVAASDDPDLKLTLQWSLAVNNAIADMVSGVPPFPHVRKCLERLTGKADMLVVSATPGEALVAEWHEHDLAKFVGAIYGQEFGTKKEMLAVARAYPAGNALMVGDAPGDFKAAEANGCLFFPINPGREEQSWQRLYDEGVDRFVSGRFAGEYQQRLLEEFNALLPERPPWPVDE